MSLSSTALLSLLISTQAGLPGVAFGTLVSLLQPPTREARPGQPQDRPGGSPDGNRPGRPPGGNRRGGPNPGGPGNQGPNRPDPGNRPQPPGGRPPSGNVGRPPRPQPPRPQPPRPGPPQRPRPNYQFRPQDISRLHAHYRRSLLGVNRARRPRFLAGGYFPRPSLRYITPVPPTMLGYLPPVPPGYAAGYYDGYCIVYDPISLLIVNIVDLLT